MTKLKEEKRNACIVVLGDIGRSPRMQYHAVSLIEEGYNVDIIGYCETKPLAELFLSKPICVIHKLTPVPTTNITQSFNLIIKAIWQTLSLIVAFFSVRTPSFLLVQNPPGVPTLVVSFLYSVLTRTPLVIDWHNYTYTILGLSLPEQRGSRICRFAKWIEKYFGSKATANFCVTKAMKQDLNENWNINNVTVLYDRPYVQFHPIELSVKHDFYLRLSNHYEQFKPTFHGDLKESGVLESTAITYKLNNGSILYKPKRMALLVSSTSWTPDEDFSLLLNALKVYDKEASAQSDKFPFLMCIITGKGPQKEHYCKEIEKLEFSKVAIITPWLEIQDYFIVLAAADLGVSLHSSSSGLDLPMKIVDMFGSGLPVCAYNFKSLGELVCPGQNGFIFEEHEELADQLLYWFEHFPHNPNLIEAKKVFKKNLKLFQGLRWHENWVITALPVLNSFV